MSLLGPRWAGRWLLSLVAAVAIGLPAARAQVIPALPLVAPAVAAAHPDLVARRAALVGDRDLLRGRTQRHNAGCGAAPSATTPAAAPSRPAVPTRRPATRPCRR